MARPRNIRKDNKGRWKEGYKPKWTLEYEKKWKKDYRQKNKNKIYAQVSRWKKANSERVKELNKNERDRLKVSVLSYYGLNGKACCVLCKFNNIDALCLDHINNNGSEERKLNFNKRTVAGGQFYRWIKKNKFPAGYQTLCYNCNMIKEISHKRLNVKNNSSISI